MDDLDREIRAAFAVEPSQQFVARVRTAVAEQRVVPQMFLRFAPAAAAAVLVTLAVGITVFRAERARSLAPPVVSISVTGVGTDITLSPDATPLGEPSPRIRGRRARVTPNRGEIFEVIVSRAQVDAHLRLFTSIPDQPGGASWALDETASVTNQSLSDIRISPITIESLNLSLTEKGVLQ